MSVTTLSKGFTFEQWLEMHYGYTGTEEEIEAAILEHNKTAVAEVFKEEWCTTYRSAQMEVVKLFEEDYIKDSQKQGWERLTKRFWWE
ncbi:hypothetical protein OB985_05075 [Bacillus cereus]|nr:hypothetical protein [Bacillus cereus]